MTTIKGYLHYFAYILVILVISSCQKNNTDTTDILARLEQTVEQNPDSVLSILDSIIDPGNLNKEDLNKFLLLQVRAKDKADKPILFDTIIFKVKDYYLNKNNQEKIALSSFYCGRILQEREEYEEATNQYFEAERYAKQMNDYSLLGLINSSIGSILLNQLLKSESIKYFSKAVMYFKMDNDIKNEIISLNLIGNAHLMNSESDSAFYYYEKGKQLAIISNDTLQLVNLNQCKGVAYRKIGDYKNAIRCLKESLALSSNNGIQQAKIYLSISKAYQNENLLDSAKYYLNKSLLVQGGNEDDLHLLCSTYITLSQIEENTSNYAKALSLYKAYNKYLTLAYENNKSSKILELEKRYKFELVQNENNKLIQQRQRVVIISFIIITITSLIALFFIRKSFQSRKAALLSEKRALEAETQLLEVESRIYQLKEMAKNFNEKENTFKNILLHQFNILKKVALIEQYTKSDNEQDLRLIKIFNEIVYEQESLNWEMLYNAMNELHNGFFERLKEQYPSLDEQEFRICCLTYAKLTSSEIALIMELKVNTVQMKRSSIRKKLGIEALGNINDFFDSNLNIHLS